MVKTAFPPKKKPMLVFDGDCSFCRYWVVRWKKITGNKFEYQPYQSVAENFKDIPKKNFQEAVHLVLLDGRVYRGAAAAYFTYYYTNKAPLVFKLYNSSGIFKRLSDRLYSMVAKRRNLFFKLTKVFLGSDPYQNARSRLLKILVSVFILIILAVVYLTNT